MASLFGDDADLDEKIAEIEEPGEPVDLSPRSNPDLLGHEDIEQSLLADFNLGRLPHAIILAGPAGIGKATLAYRIARFLLAQKPAEDSLFGAPAAPETLYIKPADPVFRRVASGGHADLITIERELDEKKGRLKNDISVDSVRRVPPFLRKTAAEGGWRCVIVDGADYLNTNSQNALLKILEEPPKKTLLILTTAQPGIFLPTIRSRCRLFHVEPLSEKNMTALLDKMSPGLATEEKSVLFRLAQGSIGKALQYHADGGVAVYKDLLKAASTLPNLDVVAVHELADKIGRSEAGFEAARDILTQWCARHAQARARGLPARDILPGDAAVFDKIAGLYSPRHFFDTWEKISQLFLQTEIYNLDKRQAVIGAFLMLQNPAHQGLNV